MKRLVVVLCVLLVAVALLLPLLSLAQAEAVLINEVAWAGTNASSADEYFELKGPPGLDLTSWRLEAVDGSPAISLTGVISTTGFYLLERSDENTVASLPASQLYTGSLEDGGEQLRLKDGTGSVVDELDAGSGWPAGDTSPQRAAMERFGDEFLTNDCSNTSGALDAGGNVICGTPGAANLEPQPVNTVRFVDIPALVPLGESKPFVARAWNSTGQPPEGSTMRFSIVSTGTQIVSIAPLTATINASGTATVQVTGLTTGTAVLVAQWFGNLGGTEVQVAYPPVTERKIYLPLIIKSGPIAQQLPPRNVPPQALAAVWGVPPGGAPALVNRPGQ